nr:MAG TPA: hypothetical protein [Caudoviricetes sp.]
MCCDYKGTVVRRQRYRFELHVCKYYEKCPYAEQLKTQRCR